METSGPVMAEEEKQQQRVNYSSQILWADHGSNCRLYCQQSWVRRACLV